MIYDMKTDHHRWGDPVRTKDKRITARRTRRIARHQLKAEGIPIRSWLDAIMKDVPDDDVPSLSQERAAVLALAGKE